MANIELTPENVVAAKAVVQAAFEVGRNETVGDFTDAGILFEILRALGCDFKE